MKDKDLMEILKSNGDMHVFAFAQIQALKDHYVQHLAPIIGKSEDDINKELDVMEEYNYQLMMKNKNT